MKPINDKTRILLNLFVPQLKKPNPRHAIPESNKNLSGKTIVFTGGTDGMDRVDLGARAIFDGYLGWFDGNPVNLNKQLRRPMLKKWRKW